MVAAGALAASLFSAPMASAATPAPVSASVTLASSSTVLADWHGRYRCWRRWGGDWHFVCGRGGHWWGDRDRGARRGDDHDRWLNGMRRLQARVEQAVQQG